MPELDRFRQVRPNHEGNLFLHAVVAPRAQHERGSQPPHRPRLRIDKPVRHPVQQAVEALTLGARQDLLPHEAPLEVVVARQRAHLNRHLLLALQEQSLKSEASNLCRHDRLEDAVQGEVVGGVTHEEAGHREDPACLIEEVDDHLKDSKHEAKVRPRMLNKLELSRPHMLKHLHHQPFLLHRAPHHQCMQVKVLQHVTLQLVHQVGDEQLRVLTGDIVDLLPHLLRQCLPYFGELLPRHRLNRL
mmetsp:Transcript_22050/g.39354  ORF Transcript_22050/g.39354 Transcript_22050/m.39354 type:complete len:245 (+) Transcript_22050:256-990(+)